MRMTTQGYFRAALLLPVAATALGATCYGLGMLVTGRYPAVNIALGVGTLFAGAGLYSLPFYTFFAVWAWQWSRRPRSAAAIHSLVWVAPLVVGLPAALLFGAGGWVRSRGVMLGVANAYLWTVGALVVGYFYVVLIELGFVIGRITGVIRT